MGVHGPGDDAGFAHFSGLERCGSIWACPVCSAVIRAERAREIGAALEAAHVGGLGVLFTTFTLRHRQADALRFSLDVVLKAFTRMVRGRPWRRLCERIGYVGFIRATEVTYGGNGWHPHLHLAIVTSAPLSDDLCASFEAEVSTLWRSAVEALGGRLPSRQHGVKVLAADGAVDGISDYVSKAQEHVGKQRRSVALELARGDLKTGRAGSVMPFELLDDDTRSPQIMALWCEYVEGSKGRRAFSWSKHLRDRLLPGAEELEDDQILDRAERGELLGLIDGASWDRSYRDSPEQLHATLCEAEGGSS